MTTDTIPIKNQIAAGIAEGLAFEHKRAFHDAQRWMLAELARMRDSSNVLEAKKQALDDACSEIAGKVPEDRSLQSYSIYLDAFEAKLTGNDPGQPRLAPFTVAERLASAMGTLDASGSRTGAELTGRFEFARELHKLLHEDDVKSEGS